MQMEIKKYYILTHTQKKKQLSPNKTQMVQRMNHEAVWRKNVCK